MIYLFKNTIFAMISTIDSFICEQAAHMLEINIIVKKQKLLLPEESLMLISKKNMQITSSIGLI